MKKPNDTKRPNNGGQSLGQLYRSRERFVHVSMSFNAKEVEHPVTKVKSTIYIPAHAPRTYKKAA